jgi:hypothetical protein
VLAEYFQPEPKEISKSLRNVKVHEAEQPAVAPPTAPPTAPPDAPSASAVSGAEPH